MVLTEGAHKALSSGAAERARLRRGKLPHTTLFLSFQLTDLAIAVMRDPCSGSDALLVSRLAPHFTRAAPHAGDAPRGTPPLLRALWASGAAWHLLPEAEHFNVFGFNVLTPAQAAAATLDVWGDAEEQQAWASRRRPEASCAAREGWLRWATFSEFDSLFVCVDEAAGCYGDVHAVVNNCDDEAAVPGGLPSVLCALADAVEARAAARAGDSGGGGGGGGSGGDPSLRRSEQLQLCRPLLRMRDAVLSA